MKLLLALRIAATASAYTLTPGPGLTTPSFAPSPLPSGIDDGTASLPPVPQPSGNVSVQYKLGFDKSCTGDMQSAILDALNEKHKIMGCDPVFYTDFNSAAAVDYFGFPAPIKFQDKRWKITNTLRNVYSFGNGWWGSSTQIQVFCGDNSMRQPEGAYCTNQPGHVHLVDRYSDDKDGLMFCDSWFRLPTLSGAISEGGLSHEYWNIENYENRARHWINALLMKKNIGTWPTDQTGTGDIARQQFTYPDYGLKWMLTPSAVKWAAKNLVDNIGNLDDRVLKNADTWSWFAMAAYVTTQDGGGIYTPAPYVPAGLKFDTVGAFNVTG